jgi:hypothetical protein
VTRITSLCERDGKCGKRYGGGNENSPSSHPSATPLQQAQPRVRDNEVERPSRGAEPQDPELETEFGACGFRLAGSGYAFAVAADSGWAAPRWFWSSCRKSA